MYHHFFLNTVHSFLHGCICVVVYGCVCNFRVGVCACMCDCVVFDFFPFLLSVMLVLLHFTRNKLNTDQSTESSSECGDPSSCENVDNWPPLSGRSPSVCCSSLRCRRRETSEDAGNPMRRLTSCRAARHSLVSHSHPPINRFVRCRTSDVRLSTSVCCAADTHQHRCTFNLPTRSTHH